MRMMATQVEVGAALTSLANLSELASEAKLPRALASPLSDASGPPSELPSPLSPLLLEERSSFGNLLRPATMTPATARPRLTPKPFCREKSAETFAVVKPPVSALKPSTAAPKPAVFAKTLEDVSVARGLTGTVPPLVDQKLVESKASSDLVANMPFYSSPQANTVILFETGSTDRARMTLTPDRNLAGVPRALGTLPAQEGQLLPSKSEMSYRRPEGAGIHRQLSLSSESRPGPWNPCRPLERTDAPEAGEAPREPNSHCSPASEGQLRLKQRPVSAIFLDSLKDPKHCAPEVSDEKPPPEKPWVRKPRPLSMDLTAKFENRDLSVQRKSCPSEVKEKNLAAHFADVGCSRPSETELKSETGGLGRADSSKSNLNTAVHVADSPGAKNVPRSQTQKPSPNEAASSRHSTPKDSGQVSAKDRKYLWDLRFKSQDEQMGRETDIVAASENTQEPCSSKGHSLKERAVLNPKEICTISENSANATGAESRSSRGGGVKKPPTLPDTSANGATLVNPELLPTSPEKESRILNIQQRIKELTAENVDVKPGNLRRSFRSRPLSADLTKLFSSPVTSSEVRLERLAELNRKPLGETQEVPESEASPPGGPDCREARVLGPPWKPQQPVKMPRPDGHLEKDGGFARERQNVMLQGEGPPLLADRGLKPHFVAAVETPRLKTVRATVFEHSVQRHNVAVDRLGTEPVLQTVPELSGGPLGHGRVPWQESQTITKKVPSQQADVFLAAEQHGQAQPLKEDTAVATWEKSQMKEKLEKPTQKHIEDSLQYQRIEPRYEVLQTVGERVRSEAVAAVPEDKAVTLRSRKSLKERRRTEEGVAAVPWPGLGQDRKGGSWRGNGSASQTKDLGEAAGRVSSLKGHSVSCSQQASHEQGSEWNNRQSRRRQPGTVPAPFFPSRSKDLGTAGDPVPSLSSEMEKEKPKACFADKMEGSKAVKRFPESLRAGLGRTDGFEVRRDAGENAARAGECESLSSPGGTCQWQKCSVGTRTYEQEDSRVLGLRKTASAYCAPGEWDVSGHLAAPERLGQLGVEEGLRRGARGASTPKAAERWRRKTLPHGAARFEDAAALDLESPKALGRRDSLQLHSSSLSKRHRESRGGGEPQEESPASPSHPGDSLKQPLSPSEPRAAYLLAAAAVQGPAEPGNAFDPPQSKPVSSAGENPLWSPSASRRSLRPHSTRFPDTPGSLDRHRSKSWGEESTSDLPRPGDASGENWRHLVDAPERGAPLFQAMPKSPPGLRHFPPDRLGPQNCGSCSRGLAQGKGPEGYRSRVLDIDALMAEYQEDSKREGGPSAESSLFLWEKLARRRDSADKTSGSYNLNSPKGSDCSLRSTRPGVQVAEHVRTSEHEEAERCRREPSPLKARDGPLSPPRWGRQAAEQPKGLPADPTSTRKKTFILDEEPGDSLLLRHLRAKYASGGVQLASPAHLDPELGAGRTSGSSQEGVSQKGMSPAQQAGGACSEEDCRRVAPASGLDTRRDRAAVGFPAAPGEPRAEWSSSESGLADAPPDLRRSSSEKVRQARARGGVPSGPDAREGVHQSSLPGRVDGWLGRRGTPPQDPSFQEERRRDLEKERPEQGHGGSAEVRSPPYLPARRRSRSFYRERRTDHWAVSTKSDRTFEVLVQSLAQRRQLLPHP